MSFALGTTLYFRDVTRAVHAREELRLLSWSPRGWITWFASTPVGPGPYAYATNCIRVALDKAGWRRRKIFCPSSWRRSHSLDIQDTDHMFLNRRATTLTPFLRVSTSRRLQATTPLSSTEASMQLRSCRYRSSCCWCFDSDSVKARTATIRFVADSSCANLNFIASSDVQYSSAILMLGVGRFRGSFCIDIRIMCLRCTFRAEASSF